MTKKTDPSISISFPRAEKEYYLNKRDKAVHTFAKFDVSGFSAIVRKFLDGEIKEIDGKKAWVVPLDV